MVRHLVPAYAVPHSIIVIAQQWPCWLSTVLSLALPVKRIFVQPRFRDVFPVPTDHKITPSWSTLEQLSTLGDDVSEYYFLCSGSNHFLTELPHSIRDSSAGFLYAIDVEFTRYRRQRDFDRQIRQWKNISSGLGLNYATVTHSAFGGVTNAQHLLLHRAFPIMLSHLRVVCRAR